MSKLPPPVRGPLTYIPSKPVDYTATVGTASFPRATRTAPAAPCAHGFRITGHHPLAPTLLGSLSRRQADMRGTGRASLRARS
jgi:hypothetical protein